MMEGTIMMPPSRKLLITSICVLLFIAFFYVERLDFLSNTSKNFKFKPGPGNNTKPESDEKETQEKVIHDTLDLEAEECNVANGTNSSTPNIFKVKPCPENNTKPESNDKKAQEKVKNDKIEFEAEECNVANGNWVFNQSIKALYSGTSCPYISGPYSCVKNGRLDSDYRHWEWQPEHCTLPRFNPELALKKLQGKRLLFVGDSLQQNQWESFVCMVEWIIPENQKSMKRGIHSIFKAKEYNATIEFYWAPMLVESNCDNFAIRDPKKKIVRVDRIMERAQNWKGVDILVFNTYVWWLNGYKIKALWGSFANGEEGYEELDPHIAYNLALRTWANWVDSTINPNKTRVFFTTMSPTHTISDWGRKDGCFNETKPQGKKNHQGSAMMSVVTKVVKRMKVPVTFINITQMSEYRIDAHSSVYTETWGKLLTEEEKTNPKKADCIHWCLPGLPDTWNQLFLTML